MMWRKAIGRRVRVKRIIRDPAHRYQKHLGKEGVIIDIPPYTEASIWVGLDSGVKAQFSWDELELLPTSAAACSEEREAGSTEAGLQNDGGTGVTEADCQSMDAGE